MRPKPIVRGIVKNLVLTQILWSERNANDSYVIVKLLLLLSWFFETQFLCIVTALAVLEFTL